MRYFEKYTSNSIGAGANQHYFEMQDGEIRTARAYFKIAHGGEFEYSLLFSGILDGNYRRISYANEPCGGWMIHGGRIGKCKFIPATDRLDLLVMERDIVTEWLCEMTFDGGMSEKAVGAELFSTDPARLSFEAGEFIAVELTFSGKRIPCHPESLLPIYKKVGDVWEYSVNMPVPAMIGCDRAVSERVAFLGDSITQGCGSGFNAYQHWNAILADRIGGDRAFWNIGIGYGTATSAASDGVWLSKAKESDTVFLCFGVNDINSFHTADEVISDISTIIDLLRAAGCRIILQTVPPFDYPEGKREVWLAVNEAIKNELAEKVAAVFDCVPLLSESAEHPEITKYGGHPDATGCRVWADALYDAIKQLF